MPKVTVLVAVYNAERFLPQCLDSLLAQTMSDFQVICIDDASTDRSLQVLNTYALRDLRIEVVRLLENRGQAHARNEGLKQAEGDIVCMLDADDWLSADALERLVPQAGQVTRLLAPRRLRKRMLCSPRSRFRPIS